MPQQAPLPIFISYSHHDEAYMLRLLTFLTPMQRDNAVDAWNDTRLQIGQKGDAEIKKAVQAARIAILLVSQDFLASEFITKNELPPLLAAAAENGVRIFPVIVGHCQFARNRDLNQYHPANPPGTPLCDLSDAAQDKVWLAVADAIDDVLKVPPPTLPQTDPIARPVLWQIPPAPEVFTGRKEQLAQIGSALQDKQRVALVGMPGVGKSATARKWADDNKANYTHGFHVLSDTPENTRAGYHKAALSLPLPGVTIQDEAGGVRAFLDWLRIATGTLLVLDNADNIAEKTEQWAGLLPPRGSAHILLTARPDTFTPVINAVELKTMDAETGAECLLEWAGIPSPSKKQTADARALSETLGGLPLALRQAGSYCGVNKLPIAKYSQLLANPKGSLLSAAPAGLSGDERTVYQTFAVALDTLQEKAPVALELMRLLAFLAPNAIPEALFTEHADDLPDALADVAGDPMQWNELRGTLLRYALISVDAEWETLDIHRLLQEVIRQTMSEAKQREIMEAMVTLFYDAFPVPEFENWAKCERLTPHTLSVMEYARWHTYRTDTVACLLNQTAYYLSKHGRYDDALPLYQEAVSIRREVLPEKHPLVASSLNNLAALYRAQGRYGDALPLHQEALAIRREVLPQKHPDIATSLNNLAGLYVARGRYDDALPLFQEALAIDRESLPVNHPDLAMDLNNLAGLYEAQGRYDDALPLFQEALAIRREVLPQKHPDIANSLNNLALLYQAQGRYDDALPLFQEALAIDQESLPVNHPDLAIALNNLAGLYRAQGRYDDALPLLQEAVAIFQVSLGETHPNTKIVTNNAIELVLEKASHDKD